MRATATAPANIALIKYWGKSNETLRLPMNSSISFNLSEATTKTSVEFDEKFKDDLVIIDDKVSNEREKSRVVKHLDRIRELSGEDVKAKVVSHNKFPKGSGIASSASGFAALTVAATSALGLNLGEKKLSILARLGSGSACRSIPPGIVEWKEGNSSDTSFAYSLYPETYWDLVDLVVVVESKEKKVSSSDGHTLAKTSPFFDKRIKDLPSIIKKIKKVIKLRDFEMLGELVEGEALNMHSVMLTSRPALIYWSPKTIEVMNKVVELRDNGLKCYFTVDAGPNVHVLCLSKDSGKVLKHLKAIPEIARIIKNRIAKGARIISK